MDRIKLNEILLMDDSMVGMQDLLATERLSAKYPYSSVFKVLSVKFAYILNSFNKTNLLHVAGIYITDREYLKNILNNIDTTPKFKIPQQSENVKEDIITKINSYQDEQLSDNPTRQELLERFLKIENPKVQIDNKDERDSVSDDITIERAIKESAKKEFKFVTETMAKVYAKQGDKAKALKIYQQLIMQNPKKEMYYNNQIEILKNS